MADNNKIHYRMPLKLITSYTWAGLNQPAKAILPVIGVYADRSGKAFPGIKTIAKYAGYKDPRFRKVREGINDLIKNDLVIRKKQGRHYIYYLTDIAIWKKGRSFFPIYKTIILNGLWAKLTPTEKALYIVLGVKAKINDPEVLDILQCHAIGNIYQVNKYFKFAGISYQSFYNSYFSLRDKNLIEFWEDEDPYHYAIYTQPEENFSLPVLKQGKEIYDHK